MHCTPFRSKVWQGHDVVGDGYMDWSTTALSIKLIVYGLVALVVV